MKKFTQTEKINGELAIRKMSQKAQEAYSTTDPLAVYQYIDEDATIEAEEKAFDNDIDFFPGQLNVFKYAVVTGEHIESDLTFEEADDLLKSLAE